MDRAWRNRQIWRGLARLACPLGDGAGELTNVSELFPRAPAQALNQGTLLPPSPLAALQLAACSSAESSAPRQTCHAAQPGIRPVSRWLLSQAQHAQQQQQRSICSTAAAAAAAAGAGSTSKGAAACPLHACLLRYGITDLAAFSKPHHLALSQEAVDADVEPKLAALRAEGLSPAQLQKLMPAKGNSILACSYQDTFAPNLELLWRIAALKKPGRRRKGQQQLTAAGRVLAGNVMAAQYLSRSPAAVQQLLEWLKRSLGIGLTDLARCRQLLNALLLSEEACEKVTLLLLGKGVPKARAAKAFLAQPTMFGRHPAQLKAKMGYLASTLHVDAAEAFRLVLKQPRLLTVNLEGRLPQLLEYLDGYMGEEGAGRRLVLRAPVLGSCTDQRAAHVIGRLAALGYQQQQIQGCINKFPELLTRNLESPDQRQKIEWIITVSPWALDDFFLINPTYFSSSTCRLASRLAWIRSAGLEPPASPGTLATTSDITFMSLMSRQLQKRLANKGSSREWAAVQGVGEWEVWVEEWLQSEEGQRWGFLPAK